MKFPRNARVFRGQLDAAPFACLFFLLAIFFLLGTLIYTPGTLIQLPRATGASSPLTGRVVSVAMDSKNQYYYENQIIAAKDLEVKLQAAVSKASVGEGMPSSAVTLVIWADEAVTLEMQGQLEQLAMAAGIQQVYYRKRPGLFEAPAPARAP